MTDPVQLRRILAEVRRTGLAICDGHVELHTLSVAAPVRAAGGEVVAGLSVVVPSHGPGSAQPYVPAVLAAARGISRALARP